MLSGSNSFANPLPGVPAVESPFFERIFAEGLYSEETLRIARDLHDTMTRAMRCSTFPTTVSATSQTASSPICGVASTGQDG